MEDIDAEEDMPLHLVALLRTGQESSVDAYAFANLPNVSIFGPPRPTSAGHEDSGDSGPTQS